MKPALKLFAFIAVCMTVVTFTISRRTFTKFYFQHSNISRASFNTDEQTEPLLTIFTAFKDHPNNSHHLFAHRLVISNWASFMPFVKPVLFADNVTSELTTLARRYKWDVLQLNRVNPSGAPFLKDMYHTVFEKYQSTFYGFANGDLLFDESLLATLNGIKLHLNNLQNNVMVVGIRTNIEIYDYNKTSEFVRENLQSLARKRGQLYTPRSVDYFFFTRDNCSLNWSSLADVVIGRVAYDLYLVAKSIEQNVNTIDATKTILSLHMSRKSVPQTGRQNVDNNFNNKAIGAFNYNRGLTTSTKLWTIWDYMNRLVIARRW